MLRFCLNAFAWCFLWVTSWTGRAAFLVRVRRAVIRDGNIAILRGWMPQHRDEFPRQVVLALRLIDEQDPRRAEIVRKNIRVIADSPAINAVGQYVHDHKLCCVNYDALRSDFVGEYPLDERIQAVLTAELASLLIHEATHGRLITRGIAYTDETWERSERLCRAQEARFRNRVCGNRADLRGRQIDWHKWHSFDAVKDCYLAARARSPWDRLSYRIRAAIEVARRITDDEPDQSISVRDSMHQARKDRSWPEMIRAYQYHRDQPAFSPANLEYSAYAFKYSGLPVAAAECFELIQTHGWEMPSLRRYNYGLILSTIRRFEEAIEVFRTIENEQQDTADSARLEIAYCLRSLDRFDEAEQMFASIKLEGIVNTQSWFHLGTALMQNDAAQALEILDEVFGDTEPENLTGDEFYAHALRPYLAWLLGRRSDYLSLLPSVLETRQKWLTDNADTIVPRRAIVVYADESLRNLAATADDAVVMIRTDRDVTEEQLAPARVLATKIRETAHQTTSTQSERTLQGLLYGNTDFTAREVDWGAIDPALRLDGTWFVAELPMDRLFLEKGKLEGDLVRVWVNSRGNQPLCVLRGELDLAQPISGFPVFKFLAAAEPLSFVDNESCNGV